MATIAGLFITAMATVALPNKTEKIDIDFHLEDFGKHRIEMEAEGGKLYLDIEYGFLDSENAYQDKDWLVQTYVKQQKTMAEIARICGCSPMTVHLWLQKHDIPTRSRGRRSVQSVLYASAYHIDT